MQNEWDSLDLAAKANLSAAQLPAFYDYKRSLKEDGHQWQGDAEWVLYGYIWDASEDD